MARIAGISENKRGVIALTYILIEAVELLRF
jgi:hypothetical protein